MSAVDDYDLKTALLSGTKIDSYAASHGFSPSTIRRHALLLVTKGMYPSLYACSSGRPSDYFFLSSENELGRNAPRPFRTLSAALQYG